MKINKMIIVLIIGSLMIFSFISISNAVSYEDGLGVSIEITTKLTGTNGDYAGYTETELDRRTYSIKSTSANVVTWRYLQEYQYSSSDGEHSTDSKDTEFTTDLNTRQYLTGNDGDEDYYTFDYIWFRIHSDEITTIGDQVQILGQNYSYTGPETLQSLGNSVSTMKFEITSPAIIQVNNDDYDPDGTLDVTYTDTYWFDTTTGFIVKSVYSADASTSVGDFVWDETTLVYDPAVATPFDDPNDNSNPGSSDNSGLYIFLVIIALIVFFVYFYPKIQFANWERETRITVENLTQGRPPKPIYSTNAPTLWDPLQINYKTMMEASDGTSKLALANGVYIIIDTDNRLNVVDTQIDRYMDSQILDFKQDNLLLLYRLALGIIDAGGWERSMFHRFENSYQSYLTPSLGFAPYDANALNLYNSFPRDPSLATNQEYDQVAGLLASRKVLDYSHGQAPLSPDSHLRKVKQVLTHKPKEVFLVGDDDLISITLARKGINVTLAEIDPYTCALISGISQSEKLPVTVHQIDLRNPLPPKIVGKFDLFVADPDFTIYAFGLFLLRGLAALKPNGIGLINFENTKSQSTKARLLLQALNVDIVNEFAEPWTYVILRNTDVAVGSSGYGKYSYVDYETEIELGEAAYTSVMFVVKKTDQTLQILKPDQVFDDPTQSIYDY